MHIDWSISVGNLIAALGLLIGFFVAHTQNIRELQEIKTKLDIMYQWFQNRIMED